MDERLIRYTQGCGTDEDATQIRAWRDESPENEQLLAELRRIHRIAIAVDGAVSPGPVPSATEIIWHADARASSRSRERAFRSNLKTALAAVAAVAAVVILLVGFLSMQRSSNVRGDEALAAQEFVTEAGEVATVRLNDRSLIRLGPESRLRVLPAAGGREVSLEGRAFFAIAKNVGRPFHVVTPAGNVRVLGTRFHLEAGASDVRLIVIEGQVTLSLIGQEVEVGAGQMTQLVQGRTRPVLPAPPLIEAVEWLGNVLIFQDTPLRQAMTELEDMYDVRVTIADSTLAARTLTMWFSDRPLADVMTVVCSVIAAECVQEGQDITIRPM